MARDEYSELQARIAALSARSAIRSAASSSRLRADADASGFLDLYRAFKKQFGPGVRILHCTNGRDSYGTAPPRGVPFSDPPPKPLKGRR